MGVEIIRNAICDRCGKECSCVQEKTIHEKMCEDYDLKVKRFIDNTFHYTEMSLRGFDSRFSDTTETKIILCGDCISSLSDWLKKKERTFDIAED